VTLVIVLRFFVNRAPQDWSLITCLALASDDDYEKIDDGGNLSPVKQTGRLLINTAMVAR